MRGTPADRTVKAIAARLIATREALGYGGRKQGLFARKAGLAANTYNQWENAKGRPELDQAIKLVDAHDITLDWIYLGDERRLSFEVIDALRRIGMLATP